MDFRNAYEQDGPEWFGGGDTVPEEKHSIPAPAEEEFSMNVDRRTSMRDDSLIVDEDAAAAPIVAEDRRPSVVFEVTYRDLGADEPVVHRMTVTPEQYDPDRELPADADIYRIRCYVHDQVAGDLHKFLTNWSMLLTPRRLRVLES